MEQKVLSVSQLNDIIKARLDGEPVLQGVYVRGEISNYKVYNSGHHYFTLKDTDASLKCVMFRSSAASLRFRPENGMMVIAGGRVSVFPRDGAYQLYCARLIPDGVGDLQLAFVQLKQKLEAEGLFDSAHKKPLPPIPRIVGVVTSADGAAIHDILRGLHQRWPLCKVRLLAVRVQGETAPLEIAGAIAYANRFRVCDVLIVGRGGGSIEELWAFNDERVARAVYASEIPVVSAVGHETDFLISDFVADLRAATPTYAAQLVAPDVREMKNKLITMQRSMKESMDRRLSLYRERLGRLSSAHVLQSPVNYIEERRMRLDSVSQRLSGLAAALVQRKKQSFVRLTAGLHAMSPLAVLSRGYSMATDAQGSIIRFASQLKPGDTFHVKTGSGGIEARAERIVKEEPDGTEQL